jgi:hypothetical protein
LVVTEEELKDGFGMAAVAPEEGPGVGGVMPVIGGDAAVGVAGGEEEVAGVEEALADGALAEGEGAAWQRLEGLVQDMQASLPKNESTLQFYDLTFKIYLKLKAK